MTFAVAHSTPVWLPLTQVWLFNQVSCLPSEVESHVVCDRTENLERFPVAHLHRLRDRSAARYLVERLLRRLFLPNLSSQLLALSGSGVRLVHSHFGLIGYRNLWTVRRAGMRHVVSFYGMDLTGLPSSEPVWRSRYQRMFAEVDRVLCEGPYMARTAEKLGCPPDKLRVHRLGVRADAIAYRERSYDGSGVLRVLIAASFREKKGIPYALAALGKFAQRSGTEIELTIIGDADQKSDSQKEKRHILRELERSGLQPRTRLLGYQPYAALLEESYRHHVFLSPSVTAQDGDAEGGAPVTILDMMASGILVVSTMHCDIPELVRHGETGLLAPERDTEALVQCLEWLRQNPGRLPEMTRAARAHVEAQFEARKQGQALATIYRELLEETR